MPVEPTPVSLPPPYQPPGNWLTRSLVALWRERRLPTRVSRFVDRVSVRLGMTTKTMLADGLILKVRRLTADEHYVREVIVERQYNPADYEINPADTVIDVGGNIGCFALWAAKHAPRGRVIAVEPVQDNFALLVRNLRRNGFANVTPLRAAVRAESRATAVYLSSEGTGHHSVIAELARQSPRQETVEGVSLPSLFEQYRVDVCHFLKLDCEGAEFEIHREASRDDDIRQQGLPADVLADFLSLGSALKRILILDTCASGGAVDLFQVASRNPFAFRGEIERLARSHGVYMIGASAATEEAKESEALGHGVLTYALLAGMRAVDRGPLERNWVQPQNPQQVVDVLDWFSFASGHVPRLTQEFCGAEQSVHTAGRGSSFPVLPLLEP